MIDITVYYSQGDLELKFSNNWIKNILVIIVIFWQCTISELHYKLVNDSMQLAKFSQLIKSFNDWLISR